ncbi:MAG: CPBP family intramembrane metalloprotease [Oscillospiraceae bacterium]|nr:CPBP family intramembrane metalloprotease [Oscillospiraceae bacterium]
MSDNTNINDTYFPGAQTVSPHAPTVGPDRKRTKEIFSLIGFYALIIVGAANLYAVGITGALAALSPGLMSNTLVIFICGMLPIYIIGLPLGYCAIRKIPAVTLPKKSMGAGVFLACLPIAMFMMFAGNLIGNVLSSYLTSAFDVEVSSAAAQLLENSSNPLLNLIFAVLLGPFMEELMFRKLLIDRIRIFGERRAVIVSAVLFGFFHGNLSQFFYAISVGLLLGYVYLRTGRLSYSFGIHAFVNFIGGVIAPLVIQNIDADAIAALETDALLSGALPEGFLLYAGYTILMGLFFLGGLALLIIFARRVHFYRTPMELPKGGRFSAVWFNPGMICFIIAELALMTVTLLQTAM